MSVCLGGAGPVTGCRTVSCLGGCTGACHARAGWRPAVMVLPAGASPERAPRPGSMRAEPSCESGGLGILGGMQSVYEAAGGSEGLVRLAEAWHRQVMGDEIV